MTRRWLAPLTGCVLLALWIAGRPRRLDHPHPQRPRLRLSERLTREGVIPREPETEWDVVWQRDGRREAA